MSETAERTEPQNISLYPSDWQIIDEADIGRAGRSATIRRIVREWRAWRAILQNGPGHNLHLMVDPGIEYKSHDTD